MSAVPSMSPRLRWALLITDILFLAYWSASLLDQIHVLTLPPEMMYDSYDQPRVAAWNWSFFPLDVAFSAFGLMAVAANRRGDPIWIALAILSLAFTIAAGGMAIGYWILLQEFDPSWFIPNLVIFLWPFLFLPGLIRLTRAPLE